MLPSSSHYRHVLAPLGREPGVVADGSGLVVRAPAHVTPFIRRRREVLRAAGRLLEVDRAPVRPVRDAVEELVVLLRAHCVDGDVGVPRLAVVVYLRRC